MIHSLKTANVLEAHGPSMYTLSMITTGEHSRSPAAIFRKCVREAAKDFFFNDSAIKALTPAPSIELNGSKNFAVSEKKKKNL